MSRQAGGAALVADLVAENADVKVIQPPVHAGVSSEDHTVHHSWALWSRRPDSDGSWVERFLGFPSAGGDEPDRRPGPGNADLVLLDDAGLGFRDRPDRWPAAVAAERPGLWVLLKVSASAVPAKLCADHNVASRSPNADAFSFLPPVAHTLIRTRA